MIDSTHDSEIADDDFQRRYGSGRAGPVVSAAERIAALEATVARLTAEPDDVEACAFETAMLNNPVFDGHTDIKAALTAFLERRMKG